VPEIRRVRVRARGGRAVDRHDAKNSERQHD
jgi:hypothetical protein